MADPDQWLLIGDELGALDRLVCMVVPDVFRGRADLVPPAGSVLRDAAGPHGQEKAVEALYELLAEHGLRYDLDPADPGGVERQKVRQPREVFAGRRGNCIDLALVFCGMALEAQLYPVLAVMVCQDRSRHTVVLIAPQTGDDLDVPPDDALDQRRGTAVDLRLAELLERGWIAVDVTLATNGALAGPDTGTFADARAAARSALESAKDIRTLDIARRQSAGSLPFRAEELPPPCGQPYSAAVRDRYGPTLAAEGVVPVEWSTAELRALRSRHRAEQPTPSFAGDILEALCVAIEARPVFTSIGGDDFALVRLQHLYADHVGQWPRDANSADELLVLGASAGIAELRSDAPRNIGPLARFLLAVAGHAAEDPESIDLGSACHAVLDTWLTGKLRHQREDARRYLRNELRRGSWALMELAGCGSPAAVDRAWPSGVVVDLIDARGAVATKNFRCQERSEQGLRNALRRATAFLPGRGVTVDLVASREWLDAGLEHWDVVEAAGSWDPMTRDLQPRMRWSGFKHDRLRERLNDRLRNADWRGAPAVLPEAVAGDRASMAGWLNDPTAGPGRPPYYVGCPPSGGGDPLTDLMAEGCGFIVWFATPNEEKTLESACVRGNGQETASERRSSLPRQLAEQLAGQRTSVIWNDPEGRDGFPLPPARRSGSLRRGGRR